MPDLSSVLQRADRAASRVPLPTDGLERLHRRRDRKRRNQRIAAGVVGIAVFVAAIWIVTSGEPVDRTVTPGGGAGPTLAPHDADRVGLVGLAPEGATPSSPEHGELVLSFMFGHTMGDPGRFSVHMYADGRLIWERLGANLPGEVHEYSTGLVEQRLTPEGVELVKAEVLSTALFDHDLYLSSGYGLTFGQIEVHDGDRLVRVIWGDCCDPVSNDVARTMPTPEQANALVQLDARLEDPGSWLPANAWEDEEITAYVPSRYSVCYEAQQGTGLSRVLALFPQPAADLLRTWDRTHEELARSYPATSLDIWCSDVTTGEARALAQILDDAGVRERHEDVFGLRYVFDPRDSGAAEVSLSIGPLLPQGT